MVSSEPHRVLDTEPNLYLCRVFFGTAHVHIHSRHIIFPVQDETDVLNWRAIHLEKLLA